jgi:LysR family glycine cleavage system transcriptional activator
MPPRDPGQLSSLNLLRAFEAAARLGGFKAAADELCVTPSAVSQQVKLLEEQLGVALFERHPQGIALSEAGKLYWPEISPHIAGLARATETLRRRHARAPLRVSLMPPVASRVVFPHLREFQQRHPDIELRLDVALAQADLLHAPVDLAIRFGEPPWPGCDHRELLPLYVQPVCPPAIDREFRLTGHPEHLKSAPLIHMTGRPNAWPEFFSRTGLGPAQPAAEFHVDDYPAAIEAARSLGVALATWPLEKPLTDQGELAAPFPPLGPIGAVYAVARKGRLDEPAILAFLDWLAERFAALTG